MNYDIVICFRIDDLESAKSIKNWLENNGYKDRVSVCSVNFGGGLWNPIMYERIEKCNNHQRCVIQKVVVLPEGLLNRRTGICRKNLQEDSSYHQRFRAFQ